MLLAVRLAAFKPIHFIITNPVLFHMLYYYICFMNIIITVFVLFQILYNVVMASSFKELKKIEYGQLYSQGMSGYFIHSHKDNS
jgi:hypothetical protein